MEAPSVPPRVDQIATARRVRRRTGGSRFSWKPDSFDAATSDVVEARTKSGQRGKELARVMPHVIAWVSQDSEIGGLACPAPADDPDGTYRVGLDASGQPEIQRLSEDGTWLPVVL